MIDPSVTQFAIYPSIGIARVGNSPDAFFFGPEQPGARLAGVYRDDGNRIRRQAARFRVYGLNASGEVVEEITADKAAIDWHVHVANTKAAWFKFDQALDIPESMGTSGNAPIVSGLRNPDIQGDARAQLAITPDAVTITGKSTNEKGGARQYELTGQFKGKDVYLGEVRTDKNGRLVFLGGRGASASYDGRPATTFANNDGWHDDVCDGPIDATITYNGRSCNATGAWVVVGPPDYAPGVQGMVTGYDLLFEVATQIDHALMPARPSFSEHIYPLLQRLTQHQWVNAGFARDFGFGTPSDFNNTDFLYRLNDSSEAARPLRAAVFDWFRDAGYKYPQPSALPGYYGDGMTTNVDSTDPRQWMALLPTQMKLLQQWSEGQFEADGPPSAPPPWDNLSPAEQVRALDRAVLDEVVGGPFHPGAEVTWPMRVKLLYQTAFRIKRRYPPAPSWGTQLTSSIALAQGGPLDGSMAGDLTRWMAVPWQTDTSSCLSGYIPYVDDYLPTFWPARVPNDVMSAEQYQTLRNTSLPIATRVAALSFEQRVKWLRGIRYPMTPDFPPTIYAAPQAVNKFVKDWWQVGIVQEMPGPGAPLPATVWVEVGRTVVDDHPKGTALLRITDEE